VGKGAVTVYEPKPLLIERNALQISHDEHDECVKDSYRPDGLTFGWRQYLERHFMPCPERYATGIDSSR
jgi:hypothetical protein